MSHNKYSDNKQYRPNGAKSYSKNDRMNDCHNPDKKVLSKMQNNYTNRHTIQPKWH